jgi:hypothetical protein
MSKLKYPIHINSHEEMMQILLDMGSGFYASHIVREGKPPEPIVGEDLGAGLRYALDQHNQRAEKKKVVH